MGSAPDFKAPDIRWYLSSYVQSSITSVIDAIGSVLWRQDGLRCYSECSFPVRRFIGENSISSLVNLFVGLTHDLALYLRISLADGAIAEARTYIMGNERGWYVVVKD